MEFNLATLFTAVASAVPRREGIVFRDRRLTFEQIEERTNRLARVLLSNGITRHTEPDGLAPWESGQDHVAIYAYNGNEYLEAMLGAFKARAVPANVNYRYVESELRYVLADMQPKAIIVGGSFASHLAEVLPAVPSVELVLQIDDGSGAKLLPGAVDYESSLAAAKSVPPPSGTPDDLYGLWTGGTTGMPKGVLWRQADLFVAALGGYDVETGLEYTSVVDVVEAAKGEPESRTLPTLPFMHGGGQWVALGSFLRGRCVVIPDVVDHLDPACIWRTVEREKVTNVFMVGDAFARPLLDELDSARYDLSSMQLIASGGAALNPTLKQRFLDVLPGIQVVETGGASETGSQLRSVSSNDLGIASGTFTPSADTCVIDETKQTVLAPGHHGTGWLARGGRLPLGYLGDRAKTEATFPVVNGERMSVPGDRARHLANGDIQLLGRDSVTINSGGEKIFAEEVEQALARHPGVYDVVVCGRPSDRWGQEVVALVQMRPGTEFSDDELKLEMSRHIARYKLPKAIVRVERIVRGPAGKADYQWAKELAIVANTD